MRSVILSVLFLSSTFCSFAQNEQSSDELTALIDANTALKKEYSFGTFKTTRIINAHSVELTGKGVLDFRISHRFSAVNGGIKDFFGLDGASMRLGLDYGIKDYLTVGIGRSSLYKEYDGFVKARLLRQTTNNGMPISVVYAGGASITSLNSAMLMGRALVSPEKYPMSNRLFFCNQLLIARKFSKKFSLQLMPTHIHYNFVNTKAEPNDLFSLGAGGRIKLNNRVTLNLEYFHQLNQLSTTANSLSLGFDIETGGHVFQLFFTNSMGMTERTYITQTTEKWKDGGCRFGFNISRVFNIVKPKEFEHSKNRTW